MKDTNREDIKTIPQVYTEAFKRKVIEEYLGTGFSKMSIQRKYGITFKSGICTWMKKLGYEDIHGKKSYFEIANHIELKKQYTNPPDPETEDVELLKKQIKELERALENEKLRSEAYKLTIEITEKEFNIPIRKKRSTK
jgi:transposase